MRTDGTDGPRPGPTREVENAHPHGLGLEPEPAPLVVFFQISRSCLQLSSRSLTPATCSIFVELLCACNMFDEMYLRHLWRLHAVSSSSGCFTASAGIPTAWSYSRLCRMPRWLRSSHGLGHIPGDSTRCPCGLPAGGYAAGPANSLHAHSLPGGSLSSMCEPTWFDTETNHALEST